MLNLDTAEILTYEQFWARDPAPGTLFFETSDSLWKIGGREIDPKLDDPDNSVYIQGVTPEEAPEELYLVVKWGSWDTPENRKILELRNRAKALMAEEEAQLEADRLAAEGGS